MVEPAPVDYIEALELKRAAVQVTLGGRPYAILRARLGEHYTLETILADFAKKAGAPAAMRRYVERAADVVFADLDPQPTLAELVVAFDAIRFLNTFRGTLAMLQAMTPRRHRAAPEDYPNRTLASIVSRLARAYGWPVDHILGLGPEEAICYLQEAVVMEHEEREFRWNIAGPTDKRGKHIAFPPLRWPPVERKPPAGVSRPMPARMMPQGIGVRLEGLKPKRRE
ncbi:MAG: hypothetical protein MUO37_04920 [Methyloceanibacter sp.]|nr:hypothetical protein [Methyloceanibacter sp.]